VTVGAGSWTALPREPESSTHLFNKLSTQAYLSAFGFSGHVSLPFLWSARLPSRSTADMAESARHGLALGDLSFYIGRKLSLVEARVGLKLPLYTVEGTQVWIGSRNARLLLGAGVNSEVREAEGLTVSGELMWAVYLNRWPDSYARAHHTENQLDRSWELAPRFKMSYRFADAWKAGVEVLSTVKHVFYHAWLPENIYEIGLNVTPNVFGELYMNPALSVSAKAGFGWSFSGLGPREETEAHRDYLATWVMDPAFAHRGYSVNLSLGLNWYP
jgi:hypothetical protein